MPKPLTVKDIEKAFRKLQVRRSPKDNKDTYMLLFHGTKEEHAALRKKLECQ